jgi:DNA-binding response OmpR family regulator
MSKRETVILLSKNCKHCFSTNKKMKKCILIIDHEIDFVRSVSASLIKEGYNLLTADTGEIALILLKHIPDLILLNLVMPDMNGLDIVRMTKQNSTTSAIPIIILSSKESEAEEIVSLEVGADDYLLKPIQVQRLLARIRSIFRQKNELQNEAGDKEILTLNGLEIHIPNYMITYKNSTFVFPRKEFDILVLLARHPGKVFTRKEISLAVWGAVNDTANRTIDVHIGRIRKKLSQLIPSIVTVPGVGYRFHT